MTGYNKPIEELLFSYYTAEEETVKLPEKERIVAFTVAGDEKQPSSILKEVSGQKKHRVGIASVIAACLAVVLIISITIIKYYDSAEERFDNMKVLSSMGEWYSPRELAVNAVQLKKAKPTASVAVSLRASAGMYHSVSVTKRLRNDSNVLPDWVTSVEVLNERYTRLYGESIPDNYGGGYLVYDSEEGQIRNIVWTVYSTAREFFDERNINERTPGYLINIVRFMANTNKCVFDTWNESVDPWMRERYIIDLDTGDLVQIPLGNFIAVSDDGKYVVQYLDDYDNMELTNRTVKVLNTETMEEAVIISSDSNTALPMLHATFSDDGRFIVVYLNNDNGEYGGWDMPRAEWVLYDTVSGSTSEGGGKIIRFTENNDAVVVRGTDGARIFLLDDMSDVTDSYKLRSYEKYEFTAPYTNGVCSIRLSTLFGEDGDIRISNNAAAYTLWNGCLYVYEYGAKDILVYSFEKNEAFRHEIANADMLGEEYDSVCIFVYDSGKKCSIVTWDNPFDRILRG